MILQLFKDSNTLVNFCPFLFQMKQYKFIIKASPRCLWVKEISTGKLLNLRKGAGCLLICQEKITSWTSLDGYGLKTFELYSSHG